MRLKILLFVLIIILSNLAQAGVMEISGSMSVEKQYYGSDWSNSFKSNSYTGSYAWYIFPITGIEFNYTRSNDVITDNDDQKITDTNATITQVVQEAQSETYGVGLRQAFAHPKAFIVPQISLGYAYQVKEVQTRYHIDVSGSPLVISSPKSVTKNDSVFGTFSLKLNVFQTISLNGSVTTVFKAFEFNEAKYNIKYYAGLSWYF